uniref:Putative heat shock protein family B member 1 isoform n=1 Tax=Homo sapiens TaxID=9606 RepID=A0A8E9ZUD7_HUMAN|nr:putative heat shock protein family B member 1 isoform [Homo sapiens]
MTERRVPFSLLRGPSWDPFRDWYPHAQASHAVQRDHHPSHLRVAGPAWGPRSCKIR